MRLEFLMSNARHAERLCLYDLHNMHTSDIQTQKKRQGESSFVSIRV